MKLGVFLTCPVLIVVACIVFSCERDSEVSSFDDGLDYKSAVCEDLMPDYTYNFANYAGFVTTDKDGRKYVTNLSNDILFTFDIMSGELVNKQELFSEGPKSIGPIGTFDGALYVNSDTTFFTSNSENKISIIVRDSVATVVDLSEDDDIRLMSCFLSMPVNGLDSYLFPIFPMNKHPGGDKFSCVSLNKSTLEYEKIFDSSIAYKGKYFGNQPYLYWPSIAYNPTKGSYVISYPISQDLYEYDYQFNLIKTYRLEDELIKEVKPYELPVSESGDPNMQEDQAYYKRTDHFIGIFYLDLAKKYVRIGKINDLEDQDNITHSITVYNDSFTKSKSYILSKDYWTYGLFASGKSIHVVNEKRMEENRSISVPVDCITFE